MARRNDTKIVVEFGVQTPNSRTVLMVTQDIEEAEHVLDLLGGGQLVRRAVSYSPWRPVAEADLPNKRPNSTASVEESTPTESRLPLVG
jgi:hypothetical protein